MDKVQIYNFVAAVVWVYTLMVIAYIVLAMLPIPYSRARVRIQEFLEQTVGPFLRLFRRFIPMVGPLDLSPMVGIILLQVGLRVLASVLGV